MTRKKADYFGLCWKLSAKVSPINAVKEYAKWLTLLWLVFRDEAYQNHMFIQMSSFYRQSFSWSPVKRTGCQITIKNHNGCNALSPCRLIRQVSECGGISVGELMGGAAGWDSVKPCKVEWKTDQTNLWSNGCNELPSSYARVGCWDEHSSNLT